MSLSTRKMNAIKIEDFELAADLQVILSLYIRVR